MGGIEVEEEDMELAQLGGVEVEEEDQSPSNSVGGEDETLANQNQNDQEEDLEEAATVANPVEGIVIMEALAAKVETGATLDAATMEAATVEATMEEEDVDIFNIESSLELGGTLIEEEIVVEETREDDGLGNNHFIPVSKLETPVPH